MATQLETYVPLKEVARKYGIPAKVLTRLIEDGIVRLARTEAGDRVIASSTVDNETATHIILDEIRPEWYEHLRGKKIRVLEAATKYDVPNPNISRWIKLGYITILDKGFQRTEIDEADVAYVIAIYKRAIELTGSSIKAGWVLKHSIEATRSTTAD